MIATTETQVAALNSKKDLNNITGLKMKRLTRVTLSTFLFQGSSTRFITSTL
jgi:hypothetical protein